MEYLISSLIKHIADNMPALSLVDEDYGQLEALDKDDVDMYPITFPAVLIETPECAWTNMADGAQKGTCTIRVRLILDCYDDTHSTAPDMGKAGERNSMRHQLHTILQTFRPESDGALIRTKSTFFTWNHGIKVYETTYTTTVTETVATEKETLQKPKISISVKTGNR